MTSLALERAVPCIRVADRTLARPVEFRLTEVVTSLSYALDLTEGQPAGHAVRTCLIGMRLARELQLNGSDRAALFYALLLKDLGCSANAADVCEFFAADDRGVKQKLKTVDWSKPLPAMKYLMENVSPHAGMMERTFMLAKRTLQGPTATKGFIQTRCDRGAEIAISLGLPSATAAAIRNLDEHFDGRGQPQGMAGQEIPLLARILGLAQTVEVYLHEFGPKEALAMAQERSGRWFDPVLVAALQALGRDNAFWHLVTSGDAAAALLLLEPEDQVQIVDDDQLDRITEGFARVIDAKSPWTYRHSLGVADFAVGIGTAMGMNAATLRLLRRGALLHDIGKLGISNRILDKPGKLTDDERAEMKRHALYSRNILVKVSPFRDLAGWASEHHERLDGNGYPWGLAAADLRPESLVLAVADIGQAITEERPYREAKPPEMAIKILRNDIGTAVSGDCVEALERHLELSVR